MKRTELVYSTRPSVHNKLCELNGRRNTLHKPIVTSTTVGKSFEAMLVCERTNQAARTNTFIGQFKGARHIGRRKKHLHLPTLKALHDKIST